MTTHWPVRHPGIGVLYYDSEEEARIAAGTAGELLPPLDGVTWVSGPADALRDVAQPGSDSPVAGCLCGHGEACHNIGTRRGVKVRTACSNGSGPLGARCPCRMYQPAVDRG